MTPPISFLSLVKCLCVPVGRGGIFRRFFQQLCFKSFVLSSFLAADPDREEVEIFVRFVKVSDFLALLPPVNVKAFVPSPHYAPSRS